MPVGKKFSWEETLMHIIIFIKEALRIGQLWLQTPLSAPDTLWYLSIKGYYDNV